MAFKPNALALHFDNYPSEKAIANAFSEGFVVSHGKKINDFSIWFLEPQNHLKERFGIEKEVLTIYSPHQKTDARTLKAIQKVFSISDFRLRADRLIIFLVHNGSEEQAQEIIKSQPEWIIVPFLSSELLNTARGDFFIRSRMAEVIGSEDLFGMSSPLKEDTYFFGREELVKNLVSRAVVRKEHSGLFGLRKAGKTSVLYAISRRASPETTICEYIDCHNPGVYTVRWWNSLENITDRICAAARSLCGKEIDRLNSYNSTNAGSRFLEDIRNIISKSGRITVLLMFDEVEFITPSLASALGAHWDKDFVPFWQTIRATSQETKGGLSFIVAGVNPSSIENSHFEGIPNPIFQLAVPHYLEPLSIQSTRTMIRTIGRYSGIDFDEDVYDHLRSTYGGHPYLMRLASSEVWKKSDVKNPTSRQKVGVSFFVRENDNITQRISRPIKDILLSLVWWYPDDYDLLRIIASGERSFAKEYINSNPTSSFQFSNYGLVDRDGNFSIPSLQNFLQRQGEEYLKEIGPFHRGEISPELLPDVPDIEKLTRLFQKKADLEAKMRRLIILYLGMQFNWDDTKLAKSISSTMRSRSDRKDPSQLFIGRSTKDVVNDLYTLDFLDILSGNWSVFGPLFSNDSDRFKMNMEAINKARRIDSHTLPITEEEMEAFENSYQWVLSRISKVVSISEK